MKTSLLTSIGFFVFLTAFALMPVVNPPAVKWEKVYSFDRCNIFKMEIYAKNNELMQTKEIRTYWQSDGPNFDVKFMPDKYGQGMETIIDKTNEIAVQIMNPASSSPMYNAGGYKYPTPEELKRLELVPTGESKVIAGYDSRKYTYTYKKIFGEVWITDRALMQNDLGVFRACKMAALHNTLSIEGTVMEMTTEDAKGGRTLMTTVSLKNEEKYSVDLSGKSISTAINKVNYFTF